MESCASQFSACFEAIPNVAQRSFLVDSMRLLPRKSKCIKKGFTCMKSVGKEQFRTDFANYISCVENETFEEEVKKNKTKKSGLLMLILSVDGRTGVFVGFGEIQM
jgi:hypothetical protein